MKGVRSTVCRVSRPWARMVTVDRKNPIRLLERHTECCLRCQAEIAVENRISRALASLDGHLVLAPAGLVSAAMSRLDVADPPPQRDMPKFVIAAAVVGVASGLAWTLGRRAKSA